MSESNINEKLTSPENSQNFEKIQSLINALFDCKTQKERLKILDESNEDSYFFIGLLNHINLDLFPKEILGDIYMFLWYKFPEKRRSSTYDFAEVAHDIFSRLGMRFQRLEWISAVLCWDCNIKWPNRIEWIRNYEEAIRIFKELWETQLEGIAIFKLATIDYNYILVWLNEDLKLDILRKLLLSWERFQLINDSRSLLEISTLIYEILFFNKNIEGLTSEFQEPVRNIVRYLSEIFPDVMEKISKIGKEEKKPEEWYISILFKEILLGKTKPLSTSSDLHDSPVRNTS